MKKHPQRQLLAQSALSLLFALTMACSSNAADLQLEMTNIHNASGHLLISIFDNERDHADTSGKTVQYHTFVALKPHDISINVVFPDFPPGTSAVVVIHDENNNNDLDSNLLGTPTEGISFSNYDGTLSEPTFNDTAFRHLRDKDSIQRLPLIYFK